MHKEERLEANLQDPPKAYPLRLDRMAVMSKTSRVSFEDMKRMDKEKKECVRCGNKFKDKGELVEQ